MNNMSRAVLLEGCLFLVLMSWWTASAQAAECRNQIPLLGGSTAIYRGTEIDTVEELQDALANPKYKIAFKQIITKAGLSDDYDEIMFRIGSLTTKDIKSYPRGTRFDWMSYRPKGSRSAALLRDSCWDGPKPFEAWTFTFPVKGRGRVFIIPTTCLNLALLQELVTEPPVCTLNATIACSKTNAPSTITISATAKTDPNTSVKSWALTTNIPGQEASSKTGTSPEWTFDVTEQGNYTFTAVVEDNNGLKSPACSTSAAVCERIETKIPPPPCEPASCHVDATGTWEKDQNQGKLTISIAGSKGDDYIVKVTGPQSFTFTPTNPNEEIHQEITQSGDYKIEITAKRTDERCPPAVCSTTLKVQPPPPCCDSAWFLRTFGGWVSAQGSEQEGFLRTGTSEVGAFKLDFNEGLGFGLDLEKRFGGDWREDGWGWSFGLFRANLNTIWQLDTPQRWIRDDDRVSMLTLTTGPNYHWREPEWDVFVGPVVGYVLFGDATYADTSVQPGTFRASFDDSFAFGARAGFDRYFGECWGLTGGLEYLKISTEANFLDVDIDPLIVKLGFVYHF